MPRFSCTRPFHVIICLRLTQSRTRLCRQPVAECRQQAASQMRSRGMLRPVVTWLLQSVVRSATNCCDRTAAALLSILLCTRIFIFTVHEVLSHPAFKLIALILCFLCLVVIYNGCNFANTQFQ